MTGRGSPGRLISKTFYSLSATMLQPFGSPRMSNCKLALLQKFGVPTAFEKLGAVLKAIL